MTDDTLRVCKKCGVEKPMGEFKKVKDCKHGRSRLCKKCHAHDVSEYQRMARLTPQFKATNRAWREKNKLRIQQQVKENNIKSKYGISLAEYLHLLALQGHKCAICGSQIAGRSAKLDHCHSTGALRGFLCHTCNAGLGMFGDSCAMLRAAMIYLDSHAKCREDGVELEGLGKTEYAVAETAEPVGKAEQTGEETSNE
jgi:hypothetical protein